MSSDVIKGSSKVADNVEEGEDWLESDDETQRDDAMASKDVSKVQSKHYDEGYRMGISKGKEAKIQIGFDEGYNEKGAPAGVKYGLLLGAVSAMEQYLDKSPNNDSSKKVAAFKSTVQALQINDLVEQDWEALEHEREHGADVSQIARESQQEREYRETLLDTMQARADDITRELLLV